MDIDDLTVKTARDGAVCTLILGGALDLVAADEFLQYAARVLDDQIERLVLDLAGVTFLDCAGVRALAMGTDDIENLRRLTAGPQPPNGLQDGVTSEHELVPVTWGDLDLDASASS